jgi:hypothetical protein
MSILDVGDSLGHVGFVVEDTEGSGDLESGRRARACSCLLKFRSGRFAEDLRRIAAVQINSHLGSRR